MMNTVRSSAISYGASPDRTIKTKKQTDTNGKGCGFTPPFPRKAYLNTFTGAADGEKYGE